MSDSPSAIRHVWTIDEAPSPPRVSAIKVSRRDSLVIFSSILLTAGIGFIDFITGPEIQLSLFYAIPVMVAAWFVGRRTGCVLSLVSSITWLVAELYGAGQYSRLSYALLNTVTRFGCLVVVVFLLAAFHDLMIKLSGKIDRMQEMTVRLSQAEKLERSQLAQDVHQDFGRSLAQLKIKLTSAIRESSLGSRQFQQLNESIGLVSDLMISSRIFGLHPETLDTLGFVPALRQYAEQVYRQMGIEIVVNEEGRPPLSPVVPGDYLFRSIKELIINAAKHGNARKISISICHDQEQLRIIVADDGCGFDPAEVFDRAGNPGLGLASIRERMLALGGKLRIESSDNAGTRVVLDVPPPDREIA